MVQQKLHTGEFCRKVYKFNRESKNLSPFAALEACPTAQASALVDVCNYLPRKHIAKLFCAAVENVL